MRQISLGTRLATEQWLARKRTERPTQAPALIKPPVLAGAGRIGEALAADPGEWQGRAAPVFTYQWLRDGSDIVDATASAYLPGPADDLATISCRITAVNAAGRAVAVTDGIRITHVPPDLLMPISDQFLILNSGDHILDIAWNFSGGSLSFSIEGEGTSVDPDTGSVILKTTALADGQPVIVTARNSGGAVTGRFQMTIAAPSGSLPKCLVQPSLSGEAFIGSGIMVETGEWSGDPVPGLSVQWLLDGSTIEGATEAGYVPKPEDDGRALCARVTATNASGAAEAMTEESSVTWAPPVAAGTLPDLVADAGDAPVTVEAGTDFTGENLKFAVNGAGAKIDSQNGVVTIPTHETLTDEEITVTASNSGGSAESSFKATIQAKPFEPFALAAGDVAIARSIFRPQTQSTWYTPILTFPGLKGQKVHAFRWSLRANPDADAIETNVVETAPGEWQIFMTAPEKNDPGASPRVDYSVWQAKDSWHSALRLSWQAEEGGPWSPWSGPFTVPVATEETGWVDAIPVLVAAPVLAGTAKIGQALTLDPGRWNGHPAPELGIQWLRDGEIIEGATAASYIPGPEDDRSTVSARVSARNALGTAEAETTALDITYVAPEARGEMPEEIFDIGTGLQEIVVADYFSGDGLAFSVEGAGATIDAGSGLVAVPTDAPVEGEVVTVTAMNSGGTADQSFMVTVEAEDGPLEPFQLTAEDMIINRSVFRPADQSTWYTPVLTFPGLEGQKVRAFRWSLRDNPDADAIETNVVETAPGEWQIFMTDLTRNAPGVSPRVDYSVWQASDTWHSALRLSWQAEEGGPWSPWSEPFIVPAAAVDAPKGNSGNWLPLVVSRTPEQYKAGQIGGVGFQFFRSWATSPAKPERVIGSQDVTLPIMSEDFGRFWETPPLKGLLCGINGHSIAMDSGNADRVLASTSAAWRRKIGNWTDFEGIYLSTDGAKSFKFVKNLTGVGGTSGEDRWMKHLFAEAPGGTPETRVWYFAFMQTAGKNAPIDGQLWKSADGGESWKKVSDLPKATYGNRFFALKCADDGSLYLGCSNGIWRSTNGGTSFSRLTSVPQTEVRAIDTRGGKGEIWCIVKGSGLYKSTDYKSFSKNSALGTVAPLAFAVSPANRKRICIMGEDNLKKYSHDGGASWSTISTDKYLGQSDNFSHQLWGTHGWFIWHETDPNRVLAQRFQHMGISTDGGKSFQWSSNGFDWLDANDIGFHPTDWKKMALGMQDRATCYTDNGFEWVYSHGITDEDKAAVDGAVGGPQFAGSGIVLSPHDDAAAVLCLGNQFNRVPVILTTKNGQPFGNAVVVTDKGSSAGVLGMSNPQNPSTAYVGKWKVTFKGGGSVALSTMQYGFFGLHWADGRILYGGNESTNSSDAGKIYRSTDGGASWSLWTTVGGTDFRPVDNKAQLCVCPHDPARVYAPSRSGKLYRIEGKSNPTKTQIFDLSDWIGSNVPGHELDSVAADFQNENVLYISVATYGGPTLFRTTDGGASWEDITGNLPRMLGSVFVHPLTSDVIWSSLHGNMILPGPSVQTARLANGNALYNATQAFLAAHGDI